MFCSQVKVKLRRAHKSVKFAVGMVMDHSRCVVVLSVQIYALNIYTTMFDRIMWKLANLVHGSKLIMLWWIVSPFSLRFCLKQQISLLNCIVRLPLVQTLYNPDWTRYTWAGNQCCHSHLCKSCIPSFPLSRSN